MDYENLVRDLEDRLEEGERKLDSQQRECYEKVDSATELAEKQNALTMTLEAKVRVFFDPEDECIMLYFIAKILHAQHESLPHCTV